jgi:2-amino-4-hydroxy-6-hydroxymethyldihydropteridine diphosphokinase
MATAYIGIGSNIGDRIAQISHAVAMIESLTASRARIAPVIETEPWGYVSANRYLNTVAAIRWDGTARSLHAILKKVEHTLDPNPHRDSDGGYLDRRIDLDLIAIDSIVVDTPELTVPHPRLMARDFVKTPFSHLAPGWTHPLTGETLS